MESTDKAVESMPFPVSISLIAAVMIVLRVAVFRSKSLANALSRMARGFQAKESAIVCIVILKRAYQNGRDNDDWETNEQLERREFALATFKKRTHKVMEKGSVSEGSL